MERMKICLCQESCIHYRTGDNKPPNHHLRMFIPCKLWMKYTCKVIQELLVIQEYATGEPDVCPVTAGKRKKE